MRILQSDDEVYHTKIIAVNSFGRPVTYVNITDARLSQTITNERYFLVKSGPNLQPLRLFLLALRSLTNHAAASSLGRRFEV